MKMAKVIGPLLFVSTICPAYANGSGNPADSSQTPGTTTIPLESTKPLQNTNNLPGGYRAVDVKDPEVQQAVAFAVENMQKGSLVKVESAQMQVVAGKNYELLLVLNQDGVDYKYSATVFVPLPVANQPMQLTNVKAVGRVTSKP